MRLTKKLRTLHPEGLGIKACLDLRRLAMRSDCKIQVTVDEKTYSLKSTIGMLLLMMAEGKELEITVEGKSADITMNRLKDFHAFMPGQ